MFNLNNNMVSKLDDKKNENSTTTSINLKHPVPVDYSTELKNFIELRKDQLNQLQKGDFVRYTNKTDDELKKGGYVVDVYSKVLKSGEEKTYIKLSFNQSQLQTGRMGVFIVLINNINKIYKKIENQVEYKSVSDGISNMEEHLVSDINGVYELFKKKEIEIKLMKTDIDNLKKENKKTEDRMKQIVKFITELRERI